MDAYLSGRRIADKEDGPLPRGYRVIQRRRCSFELLKPSTGHKGLAYSILLRAVEDGCNPQWLKEIAAAYEIDVPLDMFAHKPASHVIVNQGTETFTPVNILPRCRRVLMSWEDGLSLAPEKMKMIG